MMAYLRVSETTRVSRDGVRWVVWWWKGGGREAEPSVVVVILGFVEGMGPVLHMAQLEEWGSIC